VRFVRESACAGSPVVKFFISLFSLSEFGINVNRYLAVEHRGQEKVKYKTALQGGTYAEA
jgi:hypothetical protein